MKSSAFGKWLFTLSLLVYCCFVGYAAMYSLKLDTDEAAILSPALLVSEGQPMAIPIAGKGAGHESAFFYQLPLHSWLLGYWMKVFGLNLVSAQIFSWVLGLAVLMVLPLFRARFGWIFIGVAAAFIVTDSMFHLRMSIVRYDGISFLCVILAFALLLDRSGLREGRSLWFAAGGILGIGVLSNLLFIIYFPLMVLAALVANGPALSVGRLKTFVAMALGGMLPMLPFFIYILGNWEAFEGQFLFHIFKLSKDELPFLTSEWAKYRVYYTRHPFAIMAIIASFLYFAHYLILRKKFWGFEAGMIAIGTLAILLVTLASGGKAWHHFVALPGLAIMVAGTAWHISCRAQVNWTHNMILGLIIASVLSGVLMNPVRRALQTYLEDDTRSYIHLENAIAPKIASGSVVYGTRLLVFSAFRNNWNFTADYGGLLNTHQDLGLENEFEYLALDEKFIPRFFEQVSGNYVKDIEYRQDASRIDRIIQRYPILRRYFQHSPPRTYILYSKIK